MNEESLKILAARSQSNGLDDILKYLLNQKVSKVQGRELSEENFTSAEKTKLAEIFSQNFQIFNQSEVPQNCMEGDLWVRDYDNTFWRFNGTYWLSNGFTFGTLLGQYDFREVVGIENSGLFLRHISVEGSLNSANPTLNSTNYWYISIRYRGTEISDLVRLNSTEGFVGGSWNNIYRKFNLNLAIPPAVPKAGNSNISGSIRSSGSPTGGYTGLPTFCTVFYNASFYAI